jgi:hypothetical protein
MEDPILAEAREWLIANPNETVTTASRIFKMPRSSLQPSITRLATPNRPGKGGQNKVLTLAQVEAIRKWIIEQYN